jgi:flavin reductase (DIM6/NTAB) family NADH-FMN oxidoreductase RutF
MTRDENPTLDSRYVPLDVAESVWDRVFMVAPLVVVGTREGGTFDLAPKHMATPMGWENRFGFVCSPSHRTYHNAIAAGEFTVTYPRPEQLSFASLAASPTQKRDPRRPVLAELPTIPAPGLVGVFLDGGYLMLECALERVVDDLGPNSLVIGTVVGAYVHRDVLRVSDGDDQLLIAEHPLLAYLHPGRYASIAETMAFPFPTGIER